MTLQPLFSVIIPTYNREISIFRAVKSVLDQTFSNFELIIVDDCSTDNTFLKISELKDNRIRILRLEKNTGAATARNFGIKASKGEYVSLLDSDDYYEPKFLEETLLTIKISGDRIGFMWVGVRYHYNKKLIDFSWIPNRKENAYLTFIHNIQIGSGAGITLKKVVFEECGYFDENLPAAEDTEFFLRITQIFDYTNSPKILINIIKDGNDRLSKNFTKIALAYNIFIENHLPEIEKNKALQEKFYNKLMWLNYHLAEKSKARYYFHKIPKENFKLRFKAYSTFMIYEIFPLKQASAIHSFLSKT